MSLAFATGGRQLTDRNLADARSGSGAALLRECCSHDQKQNGGGTANRDVIESTSNPLNHETASAGLWVPLAMRSGARRRHGERLAVIYLLLLFILFGMSMALLRRPPRARWLLLGAAVAVLVGAYFEWGGFAQSVVSGFLE